MSKPRKPYCKEIGDDPAALSAFVQRRVAKLAAAPPSLELLRRARVFGVFQGEELVGGFAFFLGPELPLDKFIAADGAPAALAKAGRRSACEIGCVWLDNPHADRKLSALLWLSLLRQALRLRRLRLYFCYDSSSPRMRKLYGLGIAAELCCVERGWGPERLRVSVCRTSLPMMAGNTALYLLRRAGKAFARRLIGGWERLALPLHAPSAAGSSGAGR